MASSLLAIATTCDPFTLLLPRMRARARTDRHSQTGRMWSQNGGTRIFDPAEPGF